MSRCVGGVLLYLSDHSESIHKKLDWMKEHIKKIGKVDDPFWGLVAQCLWRLGVMVCASFEGIWYCIVSFCVFSCLCRMHSAMLRLHDSEHF